VEPRRRERRCSAIVPLVLIVTLVPSAPFMKRQSAKHPTMPNARRARHEGRRHRARTEPANDSSRSTTAEGEQAQFLPEPCGYPRHGVTANQASSMSAIGADRRVARLDAQRVSPAVRLDREIGHICNLRARVRLRMK